MPPIGAVELSFSAAALAEPEVNKASSPSAVSRQRPYGSRQFPRPRLAGAAKRETLSFPESAKPKRLFHFTHSFGPVARLFANFNLL